MDILSSINDTTIFSPAWWFSGVFVAFAINIGSAYTKPAIDRVVTRLVSSWRQRATSNSIAKAERISQLSCDRHRQVLAALAVQNYRLRALCTGGLALFLILWSSWVTITHRLPFMVTLADWTLRGFILVLASLSLSWYRVASDCDKELTEALELDSRQGSGPRHNNRSC